jgi:hypothetical protein
MKKIIIIAEILLFSGASLFAQNTHHEKDEHKEIRKEYKHHYYHHPYHKNSTVVLPPHAPRPPSVNVQIPSPPPPPRPPR